MAVFDPADAPISLSTAGETDAMFVLGSAVPHKYTLHMGNYSVHTSAEALDRGVASNCRDSDGNSQRRGIAEITLVRRLSFADPGLANLDAR